MTTDLKPDDRIAPLRLSGKTWTGLGTGAAALLTAIATWANSMNTAATSTSTRLQGIEALLQEMKTDVRTSIDRLDRRVDRLEDRHASADK